jgi:hypothetical protein
MLNLNLKTLIWSKHEMFVIFKNHLNEFWDLYNAIDDQPGYQGWSLVPWYKMVFHNVVK